MDGREPEEETAGTAAAACTRRTAWVLRPDGRLEVEERLLAVERPVTLFLNGQELVTVVATPDHLRELAYGYLADEGLIRRAEEVTVCVVGAESGQVRLRVPALLERPPELGRRWLTACCGRARPTLYFANDADLEPVPAGEELDGAAVLRLMAALEVRPPVLGETGALHWAAVGDAGGLWVRRADVGRHNALDKVVGWCLLHGRSPAGRVVVFSGRVSSEVVIKAARLRAAWIVSNAAPTALALELAEMLNLTVAGFVRGGGATLYTHPWRLRTPAGVGGRAPALP
ncbi:Sulfur carrier protein FdhD [Candidatus Hydrogenisulfobacillus filiaventi]|uniref:Sulfur carrier protein FdhD n=1 Tax=Candidatus Hydrogenisulfobacillus filiaventi TaxID=2707344 RepID=A0A6F8ZHE1_9FIRM|nr:formate dehydrogenase accessory sulfurtransferase FdhD [Bacillota bacterium]CAB1129405.1 Sulfur carrier protein FdhD [Candidatus Hydrogenisulfobacillus filiaventi]